MTKIYGSNTHIPNRQVGDLELEVISQWDFMANAVCYNTIKSMAGEPVVIAYKLNKTVYVNEDNKGWRVKAVEKPNKAIQKELQNMGYELSSRLTQLNPNKDTNNE